jgi:hypothetical protein
LSKSGDVATTVRRFGLTVFVRDHRCPSAKITTSGNLARPNILDSPEAEDGMDTQYFVKNTNVQAAYFYIEQSAD